MSTGHILVVDDEPSMLRYLQTVLELDSYREPPDDWSAVGKIVRAANPNAVIAFSYGGNEEACVRNGVDDFAAAEVPMRRDSA